MKKGIVRFWQVVVENAEGVKYVIRRPRRERHSWVNAGMWTVAALLAIFSITLHILTRDWGAFLLWFNAVILVFDLYMLNLSVRGVRYRRKLRKRHA